jgi:hypothetical protein
MGASLRVQNRVCSCRPQRALRDGVVMQPIVVPRNSGNIDGFGFSVRRVGVRRRGQREYPSFALRKIGEVGVKEENTS